MPMYGADIQSLSDLARRFEANSQVLTQIRNQLNQHIKSTSWVGPDAEQFRSAWESQYSGYLAAAAALLDEGSLRLRSNAADQEQTSTDLDGGAAGSSVPYEPFSKAEGITVSLLTTNDNDQTIGAFTPGSLIQQFMEDGTYPEGIKIRTLEKSDGTRSHIVYIPGTQDWIGNSDNAFDGVDNVSAYVGGETTGMKAALEVLRQQGVTEDEPILLVGHSQGGLIAAGMAADSTIRSKYNISGVLSYGVYVEHFDVPDDIPVTQVRNSWDPVAEVTNNYQSHMDNLNDVVIDWPDFDAHNDHEKYAGGADSWWAQNSDKWESDYGEFMVERGTRSTVSYYDVRE